VRIKRGNWKLVILRDSQCSGEGGGGRGRGRDSSRPAFRARFPLSPYRPTHVTAGNRGPLVRTIDLSIHRARWEPSCQAGNPAIRRNERSGALDKETGPALSERARLCVPNDNSVWKVTSHVPANGGPREALRRCARCLPGEGSTCPQAAAQDFPSLGLARARVPLSLSLSLSVSLHFSFAVCLLEPGRLIERGIAETPGERRH